MILSDMKTELELRLERIEAELVTQKTGMKLLPKRDDIQDMITVAISVAMDSAIDKYLVTRGGKIKTWVITAAILMTSIIAIVGGIKIFLGWFGIELISKIR